MLSWLRSLLCEPDPSVPVSLPPRPPQPWIPRAEKAQLLMTHYCQTLVESGGIEGSRFDGEILDALDLVRRRYTFKHGDVVNALIRGCVQEVMIEAVLPDHQYRVVGNGDCFPLTLHESEIWRD